MNSIDAASLANRYAKAWTALFSAQLAEEDLYKLSEAAEYLEQHRDIYFMLKLLVITDTVKEEALHMLGLLYTLPDGYKQLCDILIAHKRPFLLELILRKIIALGWEKKNIELFTVSSACALSVQQQTQCQSFLTAMCNKHVRCVYEIDPRLIAGIRMQSNHFLWEHSISKKMQLIRNVIVQ